jgi:hypothetical protein
MKNIGTRNVRIRTSAMGPMGKLVISEEIPRPKAALVVLRPTRRFQTLEELLICKGRLPSYGEDDPGR